MNNMVSVLAYCFFLLGFFSLLWHLEKGHHTLLASSQSSCLSLYFSPLFLLCPFEKTGREAELRIACHLMDFGVAGKVGRKATFTEGRAWELELGEIFLNHCFF